MKAFDLHKTTFEKTSIEEILRNRCNLEVDGKTPEQLIVSIANNCLMEIGKLGFIASFGRWANAEMHWYFCERVIKKFNLEKKHDEVIKLRNCFQSIIHSRYPNFFALPSSNLNTSTLSNTINLHNRSGSLYRDELNNVSVINQDGNIIIKWHYINELTDDYERITIEMGETNKLYSALFESQLNDIDYNTTTIDLIIQEIILKFGKLQHPLGNRNAMRDVKLFLLNNDIKNRFERSNNIIDMTQNEG